MKFNPPIKRGKFEVTSVNKAVHAIHLTVHIDATPLEVRSIKHKEIINKKVAEHVSVACKFLTDEGYIPSDHGGWRRSVGVILHNPPDDLAGHLVFV